MKRTFIFAACLVALVLAACTNDSALPNPTGKGRVMAINAMPGSPIVEFRIEERELGTIAYKQLSTPAVYDDFDYRFNFDINVPGQADDRRIASAPLKVEADREHIFVLTGNINNPTITTWSTDLREWAGTETVLEARVAHLNNTLGDIDVFIADASTPPASGAQIARLSYGDIMDPADFPAGPLVITITAAGDVNTVHYTSSEQTYAAATSHVFSFFAGNENDTSPHIITSMSATGLSLRLPDPAFASTIRFIHSAKSLQAVDIYDDETLTSLVTSNVDFGMTTADFPASDSEATYYFTPAGSTATTLFSQAVGAPPPSQHTELFLIGETDDWRGYNAVFNRAPVSTAAIMRFFHAAANNPTIDLYLLDRGVTVTDDTLPIYARVTFGLSPLEREFAAGSYDLYVTLTGEKTPIGGPYELDVLTGDVVIVDIVDTDDPSTVDFISIPTN